MIPVLSAAGQNDPNLKLAKLKREWFVNESITFLYQEVIKVRHTFSYRIYLLVYITLITSFLTIFKGFTNSFLLCLLCFATLLKSHFDMGCLL